MKILYVAPVSDDFLSNSVFHGLRSLLGTDIIDYPKQIYLYNTCDPELVKRMHGRGFTLSRNLPDITVDRTDIHKKIETRYFDYIIYGVVNNASLPATSLDILDLNFVLDYYPTSKIVFLDGADSTDIKTDLLDCGYYFKRELETWRADVKPISFSIPKEKICSSYPYTKTELIAPLIPGVPSTFIYDNEADYYAMYNQSMFGLTWKKAGWDCLRHYEILAAGSVPLFPDLWMCPKYTMVQYPRDLIRAMMHLPGLVLPFASGRIFSYTNLKINIDFEKIDYTPSSASERLYEILWHELHQYTNRHLTTEETAKYIFDVIGAP